jgi:hypothetical protein
MPIPVTRIRLWEDVAPDRIVTDATGRPSVLATSSITARFALPSSAGAETRHPISFRHSLYPAGKAGFFPPAVTSIAITVPFRSSERASAIPGISAPHKEEMSPGINARGSPVAAAVLHRCLNPAGLIACRAPGLSHGSLPDACQSITRGPMGAQLSACN